MYHEEVKEIDGCNFYHRSWNCSSKRMCKIVKMVKNSLIRNFVIIIINISCIQRYFKVQCDLDISFLLQETQICYNRSERNNFIRIFTNLNHSSNLLKFIQIFVVRIQLAVSVNQFKFLSYC